MNVTFDTLADGSGVEVIDRIERQRYRICTPEPVSPDPVGTDSFTFPVGSAIRVETSAIVLPTAVAVYVRDADTNLVAEVTQFQSESLPTGTYSIDLPARIKTYVRVDSEVQVSVNIDETRIEFDEAAELLIGARSRHDRPAATVTTTDDPWDVMTAVETFGSALKTMDPERSYPTLRGHPPIVNLGDELDIPDTATPPETGIQLEIPPDFSSIFVAAPLVYYLGASVVPSTTPRLTTDLGYEYVLDSPIGYEREVERVLKQTFFFDCVTRTEGYYEIDLHERSAIEPYVDLDFESLYQRSLSEQVAAYLEVPFDLIKEHIPDWRLTTHVEPTANNAEQLPFVVDDLAIIRTHRHSHTAETSVTAEMEQEFTRDDVITRSANSESTGNEGEYVEPEADDAMEQAWIGDSIPIGASKLTVDAFENRLDRETTAGDISISVVQNDARMDEERVIADENYGNRDDLPFEVTVHQNLTTDRLAEVLTTQCDFFHYIGHTKHEGFVCEDGVLDASTIEHIGVDTFLLNACNSYNQGLSLIEGGAIGGVVTLNKVINDGAVRIGESMARLLNRGFPLRPALTVAREVSVLGGQYIVVGDGGITVTQPNGGIPNLLEIEKKSDGEYEVTIIAYETDDRGLGGIFIPHLNSGDDHFLSSGPIGPFEVSEMELRQFLLSNEMPVRINDELHWSTSMDIDCI